MSLSPIVSNTSVNNFWKNQQNALALVNAVASGQAAVAQQALDAYEADAEQANGAAGSQTSPGYSTVLSAQISDDVAAVMSAVQNGDIGTAQSALASLESDVSAASQGANVAASQSAQSEAEASSTLQTAQSATSSTASPGVAPTGVTANRLALVIAEYAGNQT
jgi:hypothetical protein